MNRIREILEELLDPHERWQRSDREIYCTPVFGAYERVAYWVFVLNGSPPKGTVVVQTAWSETITEGPPPPIAIDSSGNPKRMILGKRVRALNEVIDLLRCHVVLDRPRAFVIDCAGALRELQGVI